jgi:hypothetical protein
VNVDARRVAVVAEHLVRHVGLTSQHFWQSYFDRDEGEVLALRIVFGTFLHGEVRRQTGTAAS